MVESRFFNFSPIFTSSTCAIDWICSLVVPRPLTPCTCSDNHSTWLIDSPAHSGILGTMIDESCSKFAINGFSASSIALSLISSDKRC